MPNRIIKESICTSETLNGLSAEQEVFFYRLLVQCDDYGRMDARPSVLLGRCYPLRLKSTKEAIVAGYLRALEKVGLVRLYTTEGKHLLQVITWAKHQQIRAKHSKYPPPPQEEPEPIAEQPPAEAEESTCKQLPASASSRSDVISHDITCSRIRTREANARIENRDLVAADEAPSASPAESSGETPKRLTAQQAMVAVLADACDLDPRLQGSRLGGVAKHLLAAGYMAEQVRSGYGPSGWWYRVDWRGKRGQPPTLGQLEATILQAVKGRDSPRGNSRDSPDLTYEHPIAVLLDSEEPDATDSRASAQPKATARAAARG